MNVKYFLVFFSLLGFQFLSVARAQENQNIQNDNTQVYFTVKFNKSDLKKMYDLGELAIPGSTSDFKIIAVSEERESATRYKRATCNITDIMMYTKIEDQGHFMYSVEFQKTFVSSPVFTEYISFVKKYSELVNSDERELSSEQIQQKSILQKYVDKFNHVNLKQLLSEPSLNKSLIQQIIDFAKQACNRQSAI